MKRLLKNGTVVNVFTGELIKTNVLFENGIILGVDDYGDDEADEVIDAAGKYICPGFIDGIYISKAQCSLARNLPKRRFLTVRPR